ncbi:hypothetical protein DUI87_16558 [Hirundo rustica rustica]|uniref:Uncharacterized protein n=1 Tax=Hirundo rustica rustica TaxID=333673 RepID=A0A3M0K1I9_HIRRU|nr:hypothetical protein DUI87_16558 [Hirundo rustica rustica]
MQGITLASHSGIFGAIVHNIYGCQSIVTFGVFHCGDTRAVLNNYPTFPPMCSPTHALYHPMLSLSSYYKGGFEQKMSRREASLILGVRWITLLSNKINEAKDLLESSSAKN